MMRSNHSTTGLRKWKLDSMLKWLIKSVTNFKNLGTYHEDFLEISIPGLQYRTIVDSNNNRQFPCNSKS